MILKLVHRFMRGWDIRLRSALRCLKGDHYVLVSWERCRDGEIDFKITHKGVEIPEAIHRLGIDAVEILQDIQDQNSALDEFDKIVKG